MNVVGVFAGIGGIELGLHAAGHATRLLCELDPAARAVLRERFPGIPLHDDIRTLERLPPGTDLLAGGFPCQDLSQAGRTRGIGGGNSGLVGEIFRLLRTHDVPHLLLENVPFMLALDGGRAMRHVTGALEELGYRWAHRVVDARAFGLPQRRRRLVLLASRKIDPVGFLTTDEARPAETEDWRGRACGFYWTEGVRGLGWAVDAVPTLKGGSTVGIASPPAIWMPDGGIVTPDIRDAERLQGFAADWTLPAEAVARKGFRWKLVGNAVPAPLFGWIGERLARPPGPVAFRGRPFEPGAKWPAAACGGPGSEPLALAATPWPFAPERAALAAFLRFPPKPLSLRATTGFLARLRSGRLRFPPEFLEALERHAASLAEAAAPQGVARRSGRSSSRPSAIETRGA